MYCAQVCEPLKTAPNDVMNARAGQQRQVQQQVLVNSQHMQQQDGESRYIARFLYMTSLITIEAANVTCVAKRL